MREDTPSLNIIRHVMQRTQMYRSLTMNVQNLPSGLTLVDCDCRCERWVCGAFEARSQGMLLGARRIVEMLQIWHVSDYPTMSPCCASTLENMGGDGWRLSEVDNYVENIKAEAFGWDCGRWSFECTWFSFFFLYREIQYIFFGSARDFHMPYFGMFLYTVCLCYLLMFACLISCISC